MKQPCKICGTPCVWCAWRCKCGMKDFQARNVDNILKAYPEWLWEKDKLEKLVSLVIISTPDHLIIEAIKNNTEVKKSKPEAKSLYGFCEYPIGSIGQWAWVKCIHCGTERFYGKGKSCIVPDAIEEKPKKEKAVKKEVKKTKKTLSKKY